jgi:hypothetical protein
MKDHVGSILPWRGWNEKAASVQAVHPPQHLAVGRITLFHEIGRRWPVSGGEGSGGATRKE